MHRAQRSLSTVIGLVLAVTLAVTALFVMDRRVSDASTAPERIDEPEFPRPGGGPRAIHAYTPLNADHSYLLDLASGEYRRLPYPHTILSPDRSMVAVETVDGRIGVARREALLRAGGPAIRWTDLPVGSSAWWSPDGRALLVTTLTKGEAPPGRFDAYRYDLATGRVRHTPINLDCDICVAGWAADSTRYLVMLRSDDPAVGEGPIRYLHPDGTPGPLVGVAGVVRESHQYSPTRRYVIVEPIRPAPTTPPVVIFDLRTRTVVTTVETGWPLVGWYDDRRVVRIAPAPGEPVLEVVDVHTGRVNRRVPVPGLVPYRFQLGSSAGLRGDAAALGF